MIYSGNREVFIQYRSDLVGSGGRGARCDVTLSLAPRPTATEPSPSTSIKVFRLNSERFQNTVIDLYFLQGAAT